MSPDSELFVIAPIVLGLIGTVLLVTEVWFGHKFEELSRELDEINELQAVYSLNPREYLIRNWMFGSNLDRAKATERVDINAPAEIQQNADEAYATMDALAAATLEAWRTIGRRTFMGRRRGLLLMGGGALIAGFAISLLVELAKVLGA